MDIICYEAMPRSEAGSSGTLWSVAGRDIPDRLVAVLGSQCSRRLNA